MADDLVKSNPGDKISPSTDSTPTTKRTTAKLGGLHSRVQAAAIKKNEVDPNKPDPLTLPNRIGIMPDVSGSMCGTDGSGKGEEKIDQLKSALLVFLQGCTSGVSIAIETFPHDWRAPLEIPSMATTLLIQSMHPTGGTPMHEAMAEMLKAPITRGIIVSDGDADWAQKTLEIAHLYKSAEIIIDTVHIGTSRGGEDLLKEIASITGGIFIKFTDTDKFAENFAYLTPARRHLLLTGNAGALIGAKEVLR